MAWQADAEFFPGGIPGDDRRFAGGDIQPADDQFTPSKFSKKKDGMVPGADRGAPAQDHDVEFTQGPVEGLSQFFGVIGDDAQGFTFETCSCQVGHDGEGIGVPDHPGFDILFTSRYDLVASADDSYTEIAYRRGRLSTGRQGRYVAKI